MSRFCTTVQFGMTKCHLLNAEDLGGSTFKTGLFVSVFPFGESQSLLYCSCQRLSATSHLIFLSRIKKVF